MLGEIRVPFPVSTVAEEHSRLLHTDPAPQGVGSLTGRGDAPRSEPLAALRQYFYAGSWIRSSQNFPSRHLGE